MENSLKVYMAPVGEILHACGATSILDMPSGSGWLADLVAPDAVIDGIDLFQPSPAGYRDFAAADLDDGIPDRFGKYDAIVTCEGIEHVGNPAALLKTAAAHLNPGGTIIITTPNIWYPEAKLIYLTRGFFPGFPSLIGQMSQGSHKHVTPWSFPWLYLYLSLAGFTAITLHDLDQPKPKHWWAKIFGFPQTNYCRRKARTAQSAEERRYWEICGNPQSVYGRNLVVSASLER